MYDLSDETTGLPPLDQIEPETSLLALGWAVGSEGIVTLGEDDVPVRYASFRGYMLDDDGEVAYAQIHIGIPSHAVPEFLDQWSGAIEAEGAGWTQSELRTLSLEELLIVCSKEGWEIPEELVEAEDVNAIVDYVWRT